MDQVDAVVLGAGISGLVAARLLRQRGHNTVVILDRYAQAGGNHIDRAIGPYTFDIGTIIFQDDSPLLRHFPELLDLYHPVDPSISRVAPDNAVRDYPIDVRAEIVNAGPAEWARIAGSLIMGRFRHRHMRNARDFLLYWVGQHLSDRTGIGSYVERFYGQSPVNIDLDFARKRMLWIANAASLRHQIGRRLSRKPTWAHGRSFVRPRTGFGPLYALAVDRLRDEGITVHLNQDFRAISRDADHLVVSTATGDWRAATVVSTIPLYDSLTLAGLDQAIAAPPTMELLTLFFSFVGARGFTTSILYNFSHEGAWKRITMYSDFYGPAEGRAYFGVEINRSPASDDTLPSEDEEATAFMQDAQAKNLFRGEMALEGSHRLENAYPIYRMGAAEEAERAIAALADFGIMSFGRQGGFDYLPTSRHATLVAETAILGRPGPSDAAADNGPILPD